MVCVEAMALFCLLRFWTVLLFGFPPPPKLSSFSEFRSAEMPNARLPPPKAHRHTLTLDTQHCCRHLHFIYVRHWRTLGEWYPSSADRQSLYEESDYPMYNSHIVWKYSGRAGECKPR